MKVLIRIALVIVLVSISFVNDGCKKEVIVTPEETWCSECNSNIYGASDFCSTMKQVDAWIKNQKGNTLSQGGSITSNKHR